MIALPGPPSYKPCARTGPGGIRCPCCTRVGATATKRIANRRFRRTARKDIREES